MLNSVIIFLDLFQGMKSLGWTNTVPDELLETNKLSSPGNMLQ